jgi:plastocyanin
VEWKNADIVPHTVTARDKIFDSGDIPSETSWRLIAKKPGRFEYGCGLHPNMKATLIVHSLFLQSVTAMRCGVACE